MSTWLIPRRREASCEYMMFLVIIQALTVRSWNLGYKRVKSVFKMRNAKPFPGSK